MIAGATIIAGGLALTGYSLTAAGPVLYGFGPLLGAALVFYGLYVFTINRRRRHERRRGGFIYGK